ncbi:MAG TPA: hypothetical protein DCP37_16610, partial [Dehalococcoidia bacterium]|nr:hypothetical protein [Dehalococcoidia bacterium]
MKAKAMAAAVTTVGWFAYVGLISSGAVDASSDMTEVVSGQEGPLIWTMAMGSVLWPILLIPIIVVLASTTVWLARRDDRPAPAATAPP